MYNAATTSGAACSIANQPDLLPSASHGMQFVLRVADALRSKPKAPKRSECALLCTERCMPLALSR